VLPPQTFGAHVGQIDTAVSNVRYSRDGLGIGAVRDLNKATSPDFRIIRMYGYG